MDKISIVIPCFNEEEALPVYYRAMREVMASMAYAEFELLFVDDGSRDGTLKKLRELANGDKRCRYLSFSRNFGKEAANLCGPFQNPGGLCGSDGRGFAGPPVHDSKDV